MAITRFSKLLIPFIGLMAPLALALIVLVIPRVANAQVTLDGPVGTAGPVAKSGFEYPILEEYGKPVGDNLFHSFSKFNIDAGDTANFIISDNITNIISRVRGGPSMIDGRISVNDSAGAPGSHTANFWMINPAGMMFGPNAIIDVGGTFNVGAVDYIAFPGELKFSAIDESVTLTVANLTDFGFLENTTDSGFKENPTDFGFLETGGGSGGLELDGVGRKFNGFFSDSTRDPFSGVRLAGNSVTITDSFINLANTDLDTKGDDLLITGNSISLLHSTFTARGGTIRFEAPVVDIDGSVLRTVADSAENGDVIIQGSQMVRFNDVTIDTSVSAGAKAGGIVVEGGDVLISNGSRFSSNSTIGNADSGTIVIRGDRIAVNTTPDGVPLANASKVAFSVQIGQDSFAAVGNIEVDGETILIARADFSGISGGEEGRFASDGGKISIVADSLVMLVDSTTISTSTYNSNPGGDITIEGARILFNIDPETGSLFPEVGEVEISSDSSRFFAAAAGSISISGDTIDLGKALISATTKSDIEENSLSSISIIAESGHLRILDSELEVSTTAASAAGNIGLFGSNIQLQGSRLASRSVQDTTSDSLSSYLGAAGSISITGGSIDIDNTEVSTTTASDNVANKAASVDISASSESLMLRDSVLEVSTTGASDAGSINLFGSKIDILRSTVSSESLAASSGAAGSISIGADSINLSNAQVSATTASDIPQNASASIDIQATGGELTLRDSEVQVSTTGGSDAGTLDITAAFVDLVKSTVSSTTSGSGDAGTISVGGLGSQSVTLTDGTTITATTSGSGDAGSVSILGDRILSNVHAGTGAVISDAEGVSISSESELVSSGAAGSISIVGSSVELGNTRVSASTASDNLQNTSASVDIQANASDLTLQNSEVQVSTTGASDAGTLDITAAFVDLIESTVSSTTSGSGDAGTISIGGLESQSIALADGTTITATTSGSGDAGSVSIRGGRIFSNVDARTGAVISNAQGVSISSESESALSGAAGSISIVGSAVDLGNTEVSASTASDNLQNTSASVDIQANASDLTLQNSEVQVSTTGASDAGTLDVTAAFVDLVNSTISSTTSDSGSAGTITIGGLESQSVALMAGTTITATTSGSGDAGSVSIRGDRILSNVDAGTGAVISDAQGVSISSESESALSGAAGSILLAGDTIDLSNTQVSAITASNLPQDDSASVDIQATAGDLTLLDSEVAVSTSGASDAGTIDLFGTLIKLTNTAVSSTASGAGDAGTISIGFRAEGVGDDRRIIEESESVTLLTTAAGAGATAPTTNITATTTGAGNAGDVEIRGVSRIDSTGLVGDRVTIASQSERQTEGGAVGAAGSVSLLADSIALRNTDVSATTDSDADAAAASVEILAEAGDLTLENIEVAVSTTGASDAGTIDLFGTLIKLTNASVSSTASGAGDAGTISIGFRAEGLGDDKRIIEESQSVALLTTTESAGTTAPTTNITATTTGKGNAGDVEIRSVSRIDSTGLVGDRVTIASQSERQTEGGAVGAAGSVSLLADSISLLNTDVSATTDSDADAAAASVEILAEAGDLTLENIEVAVSTTGASDAGTIDLFGNLIKLTNATVSSESRTPSSGAAGSISLVGNSIDLVEADITATTASNDESNVPASVQILAEAGDLTLLDVLVALSTTGGSNAGKVNLFGTNINLNNATVSSTASAAGNAGTISIGDIEGAESESIVLVDGATITATTSGSGNAGSILLQGAQILSNVDSATGAVSSGVEGVSISSGSENKQAGAAGSISLVGNSINFSNTQVSATTASDILQDDSASIDIQANAGDMKILESEVEVSTTGASDAGSINLIGSKIDVRESTVSSESLTTSSGAAGSIAIVGDAIDLSSVQVNATTASHNLQNAPASVNIRANAGDLTLLNTEVETSTSAASSAGSVSLEAINVLLGNGSQIAAQSSGSGSAGNVLIKTLGSTVTLDNATVQATSSGAGAGGGITIDAGTLSLKNRSSISSQASGAGAAGSIVIDLDDNLSILGDPFTSSRISTNATQSRGGDIQLRVGGKLDMLYGLVQATAGADGNGGDVTVSADNVLMQYSGILARADAGNGGSINLTVTGADQLFIADSQSIINADSDSGTSGEINISAPDADLDSGLQEQDANIVAAAELAADACGPTARGAMSTLVQDDEGGTPESPDRYLTAIAQTVVTSPINEIAETVSGNDAMAKALLAFVQHNPNEACR